MKSIKTRLIHIFLFHLVLFSIFIPFSFVSFTNTEACPTDWWNANWKYRRTITVDHARVSDDQTDFPVAVSISDFDLISKVKNNAHDIVFTDSRGTKLCHEVEHYDLACGHLIAWVRIPHLSATQNTKIYMYYGNPVSQDQQSCTGVWDSNFKTVQHLEESGQIRTDSTANENCGTACGGVEKCTNGKINGGDEFDGKDDHIEFPSCSSLNPSSSLTLELWVNISRKRECVDLVSKGGEEQYYLNVGPEKGMASWYVKFGDGTSKRLSGNLGWSWNKWYQIVATIDTKKQIISMYLNGKIKLSGTFGPRKSLMATSNSIMVGDYTAGNFEGSADEVRISSVSRSTDWIQTSYSNEQDPSTFYTLSAEQIYTASAPTITSNSPTNGAINVYTNPQLSVGVSDPEGDPMTVIFSTNATGTWVNIRTYSNVGAGTYSAVPSTMVNLGSTYYWRASVSDSTSWTNQTNRFTTTSTILQRKWTVMGLGRIKSGVLVADVIGDGVEEVICGGEGRVSAYDGRNGAVLWDVFDSTLKEFCQPQMADLDKDGILEVIAPLERPAGLLVLHANNGGIYWRRTGLGLETYSSPVIQDIDGDGYPEVFFCSTDVYRGLDGTGRVTSLNYKGEILHQTFAWRPCGGGLSIGDTDNDGEFELYMGDRNTEYGNGTISFWARNLTQRWNRKVLFQSSSIPMLADVTKDGILDVVVGDLLGGVAVLRAKDGATINMTLGIPQDAPVHYQPSVYDIDRDGNLEMLMADGAHNETSDDIVIWDLVKWKIDHRMYVGKCFYGPQVGDVTGDGIMEILAANYSGIFVFNKSYSLITQVTKLTGTLNYAVIQDIDGDGYSELIITSSSGVIYAFDTPARTPNPRPRTEVQFYSEYRLGAAEYVPPPGRPQPIISGISPPNGASQVFVSTSQLSFYLNDYQKDLMSYTVVTTPNVGSGSRINVKDGRHTVAISGLAYSTLYTWKLGVTDGKYWTNQTFRFTTEAATPWFSSSWNYRKPIRIDHTKFSTDLVNFPVLINVTDNDLRTKAQSDGDDILFVDSTGTKLNHEIEQYNSFAGRLIAWVRIPLVSSTSDTTIFMYYGNPTVSSQQNRIGTWDTNFLMVQHMEELSGTRFDSTSNGYNAAPSGTVGKDSNGPVDGADLFNGGYEEVSKHLPLTSTSITVELWFKPSAYSSTSYTKFVNSGPTSTSGIYGSQTSKSGDLWAFGLSWDSNTKSFSTGSFASGFAWNYLALTWNGTYCFAYVNAIKVNEGAYIGLPDWNDRHFFVGSNIVGNERFAGSMDEIRISRTARSAAWLQASYAVQKNAAAFYTVGIESVP